MNGRGKLAALAFGALFGFTLAWARLADYDVIEAMLRLKEPDVFLLMGVAMVTGMIGLRLLRAAGARTWTRGETVTWRTAMPKRHHVIGSVIFGIGWAFAGACPGPALAQIGRGQLYGLFTAGGIFAGVWGAGALARRKVVVEAAGPCADGSTPGDADVDAAEPVL
jgi:hypothetical protein